MIKSALLSEETRNSFKRLRFGRSDFGCAGTLPSAMSVKGKEPPGLKTPGIAGGGAMRSQSGRPYLYAMAIIDFASAGNLPTRLNSINLNPASRSNLSSVRKDQNLI